MITRIEKFYIMTIEADNELEAIDLSNKALSDDNYDAKYIKGFKYRNRSYQTCHIREAGTSKYRNSRFITDPLVRIK
jgi:hypothetical protein